MNWNIYMDITVGSRYTKRASLTEQAYSGGPQTQKPWLCGECKKGIP